MTSRRLASLRSPDSLAVIAVTLAVLLANLPALSGAVDVNPLGPQSALATAVQPGPLGGKPTIDPNVGYSSQALGHLAALDILHLRLPWWNPDEATGMPLAGETQAAALFPPTVLTALSDGQLIERLLLEWIAGVCTLRLLRRLRIGTVAATAGAVAFALDGTFAWFAHATINPVAFLPMLLLGVERAYAGRGWRLIALAAALSLFAGFPEVAYIDGLLAVVWAAWRGGCLPRERRLAFAGRLVLGAAVGLLLAAPILVAMGSDLANVDVGAHTGTQLGSVHLTASALPQTLLPYIYGPINGVGVLMWHRVGGYVSLLTVALALVGLLAGERRGLKACLVAWIVLTFARMSGEPPGVGELLGVLPDMSRIEFYRYAWPALELPVIVLAAVGLDDLARRPRGRRRALIAAAAALGLGVVSAVGAAPLADAVAGRYGTFRTVSLAWAALAPFALAAVVFLPRPRGRSVVLAGLLAAEAVGLFAVPELSAPRALRVDLTPVRYLQAHLGTGRFFTLGPIQPNYASYFGLASLDVNDFVPRAYARFVHLRLDPGVDPDLFVGTYGGWRVLKGPSPGGQVLRDLAGYRAAGTTYVLTSAGQALPQSATTLTLVLRTPTTWIYHLLGAVPYMTARGCRVAGSGRDAARVSCSRPSVLVRRETFFPGWHATLDGGPATIGHFGQLFQAVRVPAGRHEVSFAYTPPGMGWASLAWLAGCLSLLVPPLATRVATRAGGDGRWRPRRGGGQTAPAASESVASPY